MRRLCILAAIGLAVVLASCVGSPNYHRAYTPATGHATGTQDDVLRHATEALTDAGLTIESSANGVVVTKWEPGRGMADGDTTRYRFRVSVDSDGTYRVASLCQMKSTAISSGETADCDNTRPQWALDIVAKVNATLSGTAASQ
jgi:hypothetical protein